MKPAIYLLSFVALVPFDVIAGVYRCIGSDGQKVFQSTPCGQETVGESIKQRQATLESERAANAAKKRRELDWDRKIEKLDPVETVRSLTCIIAEREFRKAESRYDESAAKGNPDMKAATLGMALAGLADEHCDSTRVHAQ